MSAYTEPELAALIAGFCDRTLPIEAWTHQAHVAAAVDEVDAPVDERRAERAGRVGVRRLGPQVGPAEDRDAAQLDGHDADAAAATDEPSPEAFSAA